MIVENPDYLRWGDDFLRLDVLTLSLGPRGEFCYEVCDCLTLYGYPGLIPYLILA